MKEQTTLEARGAAVQDRRPGQWWWVVGGALVLGLLLFYLLGGGAWLTGLGERLPQRPAQTLANIVNVFTCCIFTWKALTTMLPAVLLGGAIAAFVPAPVILRYLGAKSNKLVAYPAAAISGMLLSLCSCNIVPLFVGIYRRGAGIGPAFTVLFAGPALNVLAIIFTIQVIGWRLGVWRAVGVPLIAIAVGLCMAALARETKRAEDTTTAPSLAVASQAASEGDIWSFFGLLLTLVLYGAWHMPWLPRIIGMTVLAAAAAALLLRRFSAQQRRAWLRETWGLIKLVVPVLLPAILAIGALATFMDVKLVARLLGSAREGSGFWGQVRPILVGDLFGALMYFPILSEVAFTKAFLKLGMDVGPALAILLAGPGLSLPGLFIITRVVGWRKALLYQGLVLFWVALYALLFTSQVGQYICSCILNNK
jgi:hypothetical protein